MMTDKENGPSTPPPARYLIVMAVACVALLTLGAQTRALKGTADLLNTSARQATAERDVYKVSILKEINGVLSTFPAAGTPGSPANADGLYVLVDSRCRWCRVSLEDFQTRGASLPMRVASFRDSPDSLGIWLQDIGFDPTVVADSSSAGLFALLPTTATPIFLEVRDGMAHDIIIGQPKEEWFGRTAERGR
jgi:hypothetical protein